jgi:hypothetical protein
MIFVGDAVIDEVGGAVAGSGTVVTLFVWATVGLGVVNLVGEAVASALVGAAVTDGGVTSGILFLTPPPHIQQAVDAVKPLFS